MNLIERIINQTIKKLDLNLKKLVVYTEAASGYYIFTPVIAALTGADVIAFSKDSIYGTVKDIKKDLKQWAQEFRVVDKIKIVTQKNKEDISRSNIVTNSGFLRPINKNFIEMMKSSTVIALMFEKWEFRREDIDASTCKQRGIKIAGVNENHPLVDVFSYSGILAIKLLLEAKIGIYKNRFAVLSQDKFGIIIEKYLKNCGAAVVISNNPDKLLKNGIFDVIIYADYYNSIQFSPDNFAILKKNNTRIIQFLGGLNYEQIKNNRLDIYPDQSIPAHKMAQTFADLGPRPVIELQSAGLKAAEITLSNKTIDKKNQYYNFTQLVK